MRDNPREDTGLLRENNRRASSIPVLGTLLPLFSWLVARIDRSQSGSGVTATWFLFGKLGNVPGVKFSSSAYLTAHRGVIDQLLAPRFAVLWDQEFGGGEVDEELVPVILEAVKAIREAYRPFISETESGQPTYTLLTKVILGTFGCLPACDRYFIAGFKSRGLTYSR